MTDQTHGGARKLFWKMRILAIPTIYVLLLCAAAIYAGFANWNEHRVGAIGAFALAGLFGWSTFSWTARVLRWEPEEVDAYEKSTRGIWWQVITIVFGGAFALFFVERAIGPVADWTAQVMVGALAILLLIWLALRSRKFDKEARRKIAGRKAREAQ